MLPAPHSTHCKTLGGGNENGRLPSLPDDRGRSYQARLANSRQTRCERWMLNDAHAISWTLHVCVTWSLSIKSFTLTSILYSWIIRVLVINWPSVSFDFSSVSIRKANLESAAPELRSVILVCPKSLGWKKSEAEDSLGLNEAHCLWQSVALRPELAAVWVLRFRPTLHHSSLMVSGESVEKVTWLINTHSAKGDSNRSLFITSFQCVPYVHSPFLHGSSLSLSWWWLATYCG